MPIPIVENLVHATIGTENSLLAKKISLTSDGRIWICLQDASNNIKAYRSDNGSSWTMESTISGSRYPSIWVDGNDAVLNTASNSTFTNSPKYKKRNGTWGTEEDVNGSNQEHSQILSDSNDDPICIYGLRSGGQWNEIAYAKRGVSSWPAGTVLNMDSGWHWNYFSACIDANDVVHVVWEAIDDGDATSHKIQTAYYDGSWSSITTLETYTGAAMRPPVINVIGSYVAAAWIRDGLSPYTSRYQIRFSLRLDSGLWDAVQTVTTIDQNHWGCDMCLGPGGRLYLIYTERWADPSTSAYNFVCRSYDRVLWGEPTTISEGSIDKWYPSVHRVTGDDVHIAYWRTNGGNYDMYYGLFNLEDIGTPVYNYEPYDAVGSAVPDVNQTLSLCPQAIMTEMGAKNDVIHLGLDRSEERINLYDKHHSYFRIRYDLLDESDAGTIMDFWYDSAKGDGKLNSFKFSHPDGHTYVVKFHNDLTRLMKPVNYGVQQIMFKVLGRINE